jgi:hypothetical protein
MNKIPQPISCRQAPDATPQQFRQDATRGGNPHRLAGQALDLVGKAPEVPHIDSQERLARLTQPPLNVLRQPPCRDDDQDPGGRSDLFLRQANLSEKLVFKNDRIKVTDYSHLNISKGGLKTAL